MIVVDSNIIAYAAIEGDFTQLAEKVFQTDGDWVAPNLWQIEFRNILAGYLRRKTHSFETIIGFYKHARDNLITKTFEVEYSAVLDLVNTSTLTAYDCEFVALAMELKTKLVTLDKKILSEFPNIAISLLDF